MWRKATFWWCYKPLPHWAQKCIEYTFIPATQSRNKTNFYPVTGKYTSGGVFTLTLTIFTCVGEIMHPVTWAKSPLSHLHMHKWQSHNICRAKFKALNSGVSSVDESNAHSNCFGQTGLYNQLDFWSNVDCGQALHLLHDRWWNVKGWLV